MAWTLGLDVSEQESQHCKVLISPKDSPHQTTTTHLQCATALPPAEEPAKLVATLAMVGLARSEALLVAMLDAVWLNPKVQGYRHKARDA